VEQEDEGYRVDIADGVLTLTFDRPERGNAIPSTIVPGLIALFEGIDADESIRAVLVRAEGPHFSLGGDVKGFAAELDQPVEALQADFHARLDRVSKLVMAFRRISVPIVVACQGGVAGAGLMYPLGADYVLGDASSFLVFAHQRVGLTPDGGVSYLLPRVVGERLAREFVLTAAKVDAPDALRFGILSRIVDADALQDEAAAQARRFARAPRAVVRTAKQLINSALQADLATQLDAERDAIVASVGHGDFGEGVRAFLEKRPPTFEGTISK
jgi:2-(1,2-epoxy-1,2-dihydrophenyl)acetyl-CoA isomerase